MRAHLKEKILTARQTIAQIQGQPRNAANAWLLDQEQTQLAMYECTLKAMGGWRDPPWHPGGFSR